MNNIFSTRSASLNGPGSDYLPVTPADGAELPEVAVALYVESGGSVAFTSVRGTERTVVLCDGGWLLCGVRAVKASGTTAQGIHAVVIS
ncbi:hypothetical protein [Roseobacter sp. HKCCA0434]|uniref:spike base protein, RCAP_Rcc01079 family n=1 Tax=Roseobacter sp. HKCCA0434 TaxID=3079297 RepID=UPI0029059C25|nr:hypothetical protein [Roseobacter sp. HKCCA0434]